MKCKMRADSSDELLQMIKNDLHVTHYNVHVFEALLNIIYKNI